MTTSQRPWREGVPPSRPASEARPTPCVAASGGLARHHTGGGGTRRTDDCRRDWGRDGALSEAGHLASWAGLCPGNHASAGTRKTGKTTQGSPLLRAALVQAAWAASQSRGTYLAAQYPRWVKRMGKKKALVAVAHSILVIMDHMVSRRTCYVELGEDAVTPRSVQAQSQRLIRPLEALGLRVTVEGREEAA